jgi:tRNA(Ile)-lysidine synthase
MLLKKFNAYIVTNQLFQQHDTLLLAVSGGLDSVVLCELCRQAGRAFVMAHCNFRLRGEESERDESFVRNLAASYGVELFVKSFDTSKVAVEQKKSIETIARELRYEWFAQLINPSTGQPFMHILTAHHADDNIETAVMNFFRGTGIAGIRAMLPVQGSIKRPLLFARRIALEEFAVANKLAFVTDSTNAANDYTRNLFRNKILPLVNKVYPGADKNVLNNIQRFTETALLYQQAIDLHKKKLLEQKGREWHIPVLKLVKTVPLNSVLYEIIKDFGFSAHQTDDVAALLQSETGKYVASATYRILKNRHWLIIAPIQTKEARHIVIEENDQAVHFENGVITVKFQTSAFNPSPSAAFLDAASIQFPLLLRKWKQGDYFYPLGMKKKKKISRFFIDQKLSLLQKENAWVIEMDKKIVWVVGMRIDDRFKTGPHSRQMLHLALTHAENLA